MCTRLLEWPWCIGGDIYSSNTPAFGVTSPQPVSPGVSLATYGSGSGVGIQRSPISRVMLLFLLANRALDDAGKTLHYDRAGRDGTGEISPADEHPSSPLSRPSSTEGGSQDVGASIGLEPSSFS
jgi:hypothetical protein